ncbi:hypothetical protein GCM10028818_40940 [Spirosoma horti]
MNQTAPKNSSTFGIIAIVTAIIAFNTPRFMLSMVLIALAAFTIIGFVRDGNKIFSSIALLIGLFLLYAIYQDEAIRADNEAAELENASKLYSVKYEVICPKCSATYTNATGGSDEDEVTSVSWSKTLSIRGDQYVHLSAQNSDYGGKVTAYIYVNDHLMATEESTGEYKIASVSCQPKDVYNK